MMGIGVGSRKKYSRPEDCVKGHLIQVDSCNGYAESGWQNSGAYYFIAKGKPKQEFCVDFLKNVDALQSEVGRSCRAWNKEDCSKYGGNNTWICYTCNRMATNGNTHYYLLAASSVDCAQGVFFSGSRFSPEEFSKEIDLR
jgi:hypothetical protein